MLREELLRREPATQLRHIPKAPARRAYVLFDPETDVFLGHYTNPDQST